MNAIFDNYFAMSAILREDAYYILEKRDDSSPKWRRQYVRSIVPHIEGLVYCFAEVCRQIPEADRSQLIRKERKVLSDECLVGVAESFKSTLKLFYQIFDLSPTPNFGGTEWRKVQRLFEARHALMHPKNTSDLFISDGDWNDLFDGSRWALNELFQIDKRLADKFDIAL